MVRAPLWPFLFLWTPWFWYYPNPNVLNGRLPQQPAARVGGLASLLGVGVFIFILIIAILDPYYWIYYLWVFLPYIVVINSCASVPLYYLREEVQEKKTEPMLVQPSTQVNNQQLRSLRMQL